MAFAREIIVGIKNKIGFERSETEKDSYYTLINNTLLRVSNHCTRLYVWDNYLETHPKYKGLPIVSIVFEDDVETFNEDECLTLKRFRKRPIKVKEYVYRMEGNPQFITKKDESLIIQTIKSVSGEYVDKTNKSKPYLRISRNPDGGGLSNIQIIRNKTLTTENLISLITEKAFSRLKYKLLI